MLCRALFLKKNRLKKAGREFSNQGKFSLKTALKQPPVGIKGQKGPQTIFLRPICFYNIFFLFP